METCFSPEMQASGHHAFPVPSQALDGSLSLRFDQSYDTELATVSLSPGQKAPCSRKGVLDVEPDSSGSCSVVSSLSQLCSKLEHWFNTFSNNAMVSCSILEFLVTVVLYFNMLWPIRTWCHTGTLSTASACATRKLGLRTDKATLGLTNPKDKILAARRS